MQHIPFSLAFAYGIDGQVDCILPYNIGLVVVVFPVFPALKYGQTTLLTSVAIHLTLLLRGKI